MINKLVTKTVYSGYDILHGGKLSRLYRDIKSKNNASTPFDSEKLNNYLIKWGMGEDIRSLPVMTKDDIRKYVSSADRSRISSFAYTGGSTGEPLRMPYSKTRELIRTASITYYNELAGYSTGDRFLFIRAKEKSKILQFLRNEVLFIPKDLSEPSVFGIAKKIIDKKIEVIIGYPTVIYEIALVLNDHNGLKEGHKVKSIITVSEPLSDSKRELIYKSFNCALIDRYSNEEVGVIAQQRRFGGEYLTDQFGVYTEVLNPETLQPAGVNEIGRVVVTDVYNDIIPVVRYDTGDFAIASEYKEGKLISISGITGRESEQIFATNGTPVSSLIFGPYIHKPFSEKNIKCQFQFSQVERKKYELRIKGDKGDIHSDVISEIIRGLKEVLGADSRIVVLFLPDIEPLPSGKRPLYLNQWQK